MYNMFVSIYNKLKQSLAKREKPMQLSIYYTKEDQHLIQQLDAAAKVQRKSKGSLILSILQDYLQKRKRLGTMLLNIAAISKDQLDKALKIQQKEEKRRLLGDILLDQGFVEEKTLSESLALQKTKTEWLTQKIAL